MLGPRIFNILLPKKLICSVENWTRIVENLFPYIYLSNSLNPTTNLKLHFSQIPYPNVNLLFWNLLWGARWSKGPRLAISYSQKRIEIPVENVGGGLIGKRYFLGRTSKSYLYNGKKTPKNKKRILICFDLSKKSDLYFLKFFVGSGGAKYKVTY